MKKSIFIFLLFVAGCHNQTIKETNNKVNSKEKAKIFNTNYWVTDGNIDNDTMLLISSGGPKWEMDILTKGKTIYRYIPRYKEYGIAYIHQSQTFDNRIYKLDSVLTIEDSRKEVIKNSEMLHKAISYFKEKNKTVIVIGKSHGAYVIQDYLATKLPQADKYFILAGRLKMNNKMNQQHLRGFSGEFSEDGLTYLPESEKADLSDETEQDIRLYKNKQMLKVGYGATDYIEKLKKVDLTKVTYIYGTADQNIGRLTDEEVLFLESKGVKVIKTDKDHSGINYVFIDKLTDGSLKL